MAEAVFNVESRFAGIPDVRSQAFTIDGHDFYALDVGNNVSLVCDTGSGDWFVWRFGDGTFGFFHESLRWRDSVFSACRDGVCVLDPASRTDDDDPIVTSYVAWIPVSGRESVNIKAVSLENSLDAAEDTEIALQQSDDYGATWDTAVFERTASMERYLRFDCLKRAYPPGKVLRWTDRRGPGRVMCAILESDE